MIWKSNTNGDDKLIAFVNNTIYKGNPKRDEIENLIGQLNNSNFKSDKLIGIPLSYIKEIHLDNSTNFIEVFYGRESSEHLQINDASKRNEIFNYLKETIPNSKSYTDHYSKWKTGKKPLVAFGIILSFFILTLYIATDFENDYEGRYNFIIAAIIGLASLGTQKVVLIFGSLLGITAVNFFIKTRTQKVVDKIIILR